ncbi:uncharacterized protein PGTG_21412 [Puccinia graminis f. sp. tritici CRL 75-36-700-3]|uniref:Uncharacterized protein n=1 Tax=Puccinia graminis f. sp. tritici (strain CRL 75-36-700-3 / race SCCL) TaxID=418459 RepID=H6QR91_PUCGT|nr:uncharacterized protein PGTG_21412 [Puccinia graminis f. sp. tritici CRL 75-36-700-3]EHS63082.1 hypothetical protein PGTG_21412 [Puccinia graminis f. sp. tritici CRL 75-36-700-3]
MRPNSNEQAIGTTVEAHGDQSTGPKHNETAEGTAAEAHELFTDEELVEVFRVLFNSGNTGIFRSSLTSGKLNQIIQTLVSIYGFTSPFRMDYINTHMGKIPGHYAIESFHKQWCARGEFSRWQYYYPDYIAFQSLYDIDNTGAHVGFIAGTESDGWTWTIIHQPIP